ncbi:MAG: autotransporter assembly complex family protein [Arenimonas sp.]
MTRRPLSLTAFAFVSLLLATRAEALQVKSIEFTGLDEAQVLNVRSELSLTDTQLATDSVISDNRLDYLMRLAPREIRRGLEAFGYYDAAVESKVVRNGDDVSVQFAVVLGEPVQVRKLLLNVAGDAGKDPVVQAQVEDFRPKTGFVFHHGDYETSKINIGRALSERGYFDADLNTHKVEVTRAEHAADIELDWLGGARYRFGEARFEGHQFTDKLLAKLVPWEPGQPFDQSQLFALQKTLADLDYFAAINVQPLPDQAKDGVVPIQISLTPAKRSIYSLGLRYGTDSGAGFASSLERRWVNRKGHKLFVGLNVAQEKSDFTAQYRVPAFSKIEGWYGFRTSIREEKILDITTQYTELALSRNGRWRGWDLAGALEYKRERYDDPITSFHNYSTIVAPVISAERKKFDDINSPSKAYRFFVEARVGSTAIGSDIDFVQLRTEARYIHSIGFSNRILLRGELGTTITNDFDRFPPSQRFYAGGDHSVRGYGYRELGEGVGTIVGGKHVAVASVEFEHMFNPTWGAAAFVDGGDAFDEQFDANVGVGLGLRWRSPVGPIRIDIGHGLNEPDQNFRLHISLGPDLQ